MPCWINTSALLPLWLIDLIFDASNGDGTRLGNPVTAIGTVRQRVLKLHGVVCITSN